MSHPSRLPRLPGIALSLLAGCAASADASAASLPPAASALPAAAPPLQPPRVDVRWGAGARPAATAWAAQPLASSVGAEVAGEEAAQSDWGSGAEAPQSDWGWQKWLLWPIIVYFFWAQSLVCDEYFVPSVQVFAETFHIPDDVAGATVMALGCNGPELFVNAIALFITHSDIGVGTIVGSDVFNLLLICGFSALCTPGGSLKLDGGKLCRDLVFYAVSIGLLYWAIRDGTIELLEAIVLSMGVVLFGTTVALWSRILALGSSQSRSRSGGGDGASPLAPSGDEVPAPQADEAPARVRSAPQVAVAASDGLRAAPSAAFLERLAAGMWLEVRPGGHVGRLQSRWRPLAWRFVKVDCKGTLTMVRRVSSLASASGLPDAVTRRLSAPSELTSRSTRGRLGRLLSFSNGAQAEQPTGEGGDLHADLQVGDFLGRVTIHAIDIEEVVPADGPEFRIVCSPPRVSPSSFEASASASFRPAFREQPLEWEFRAASEDDRRQWVDGLSGRLQDALAQPTDQEIAELVEEHREAVEASVHGHTRSKTCRQRLWSLVEWVCFPVEFSLEVSVPECHVGSHRRKWPITFLMSMVWLAVFSYALCTLADMVHQQFALSNSLLGLTLTAAGTSFPNLVASILVAKRGQSGMAIANAVGSNIQNVFLALGFPWVVKALASPGRSFPQSTEGIVEGVFWMAGTLGLFAALVSLGRCGLGRLGAVLLVATYVGFLAYAIFTAS